MKKALKIVPISALRDNYIWAIHHTLSKQCIVIDPGEAMPVLSYLKTHQAELVAILVTHKHWDHIGGISKLQECFPKVAVYGSALEAPFYTTKTLGEGDKLSLFSSQLLVIVYEVPGHTQEHIAYYIPEFNGYSLVFTGDTLFSGGCGRLLEGTPSQLYQSLLRLKGLPMTTRLYAGHEYTITNLEFAHWLEPDNLTIKSTLDMARACLANQKPTLPSMLETECAVNPFLRCNEKSFIRRMEARLALSQGITPLALFTHLRSLKDNWKGPNFIHE